MSKLTLQDIDDCKRAAENSLKPTIENMEGLIRDLASLDNNEQLTVLHLTMMVARAKKMLGYWDEHSKNG